MKKIISFLFGILASAHVSAVDIILFIGDGMGENHRKAAQWVSVGKNQQLHIDKMPIKGWMKTASANSIITDSAAGMTAIVTGSKTNNGMISVTSDGKVLTTILEQAKQLGKSTGLVTTTQISHATPAALVAHLFNRESTLNIAAQMLAANVDVLLGGGEDDFLPTTEIGYYPALGKRLDGRHLIREARLAAYTFVFNNQTLMSIPQSTSKLLGLFADEGMIFPHSPTLAEMTSQAIEILSKNPKGFFLMVEAGQIDWESHANNARNMIENVINLDKAVQVAQNYAKTNDTLIIVTADHETGGLSLDSSVLGILDENTPFFTPDKMPFYINWITQGHTGFPVPVTAQGRFSNLLTGTYENTHIYDVMYQALIFEYQKNQ